MQEQNRKSSFPIVMLLVSVALWIASLSNVAFYLGNHGSMEGLTVLILGSIFASLDIRYCAVYANYVWLAAIVLLALRKKVVPVHAALWGLALVAFSVKAVYVDEAGNTSDIVRYGAGFYLWYAAFAVATIGTFAGKNKERKAASAADGIKMTFDKWLGLSKLPKNEARMLLQYVSEYTRVQLLTRGGEEMPDEVRQRSDRLAQRRLNGEPVAYILGVREFYGRRFTVNPSVLIPRPETEHLVEAVLARLPENGRVWDLGTGSGAVAVTVALERPDAFVRASDISPPALETARKNAADLGARVEFAHGSWFDTDMPSEGKWDIIVSNPPYIENGDKHLSQGDLRFEPQIALTDFSDGLSCIRTLAQGAPDRLAEGGFLLLEHGFDQGAAVRGVLAENGFSGVETLPDLAGLDRVTLGKYMKHLK